MVTNTKPNRRSVPKGDQPIIPGAWYSTNALLTQIGWGRETIAEARQSGLVTPVLASRQLMYDADELIAWLKSKKR